MSGHGWDESDLRTRFTRALSDMYRAEVPLYGKLVELVHEVDKSILVDQGLGFDDLPHRHQLERHGAIRVGSDAELKIIKRLFALLGMYPVGYYDLKVVDFPLHATAFRPISEDALAKNPFRVFTSVLRKDLLPTNIRTFAESILAKRELFTPRLLELIRQMETEHILKAEDTDDLISESLKIFKWHSESSVSIESYLTLKAEHPMIADIVCFPSAHINHLTPRTLDIDLVQSGMIKQHLPAKDKIEGPPRRRCPILLRQTSFKALEEPVNFRGAGGEMVHGTHTARFGEIEQRGAAVTRKGRELYDQLIALASRQAANGSSSFDNEVVEAFKDFPDDWEELRRQELVYFRYRAKSLNVERPSQLGKLQVHAEELVSSGLLDYEPITYEDFLPLSAAGIFTSNLGQELSQPSARRDEGSVSELEMILECQIIDPFSLYDQLQQDSLVECAKVLGIEEIRLH